MDYFFADPHFDHGNIIKYCNRPFANAEEMNAAMYENINMVVRPNDILWCLGDWSFRNHAEHRARIKCKTIHLIKGNHDNAPHEKLQEIFASVRSLRRIKVQYRGARQHIVLCHYAMRVWDLSHHGAWHLYGHSHGTLPDDPRSLSIDVGVDCHDFKPLNVEQIGEIMARKKCIPVDHHNEKTQ